MDSPYSSLVAMSQVLCPPKILKENFPNDREYTFEALVEQLGLIELHIRDGSWRLCSCNPEKHLPVVAGLTSEGFGFAETDDERHFMECSMSQSRLFKAKIKSGKYRTQEHMNIIKDWARELRHRIEAQNWAGTWEQFETPSDLKEIIDDLNELAPEIRNNLTIPELEEEMTHKMVHHLCDKHNIPYPKIKFVDACDPMYPNAAHIQKDQITPKGIIPRPELDVLVFCRGGATAYAISHEFSHLKDHYEGKIMANEEKAHKFASKTTTNQLYTPPDGSNIHISPTENNLTGKSMSLKITRAQSEKGLTAVAGLATAKLLDYFDPQLTAMLGPLGTAAGKIAVGAIAAYYGLTRLEGLGQDFLLFGGTELALSEVAKYVVPPPIVARAVVAGAPVAIPLIPGRAEVIPGATSIIGASAPFRRTWATPTRLTAGYPQVAQADGKYIQIRV